MKTPCYPKLDKSTEFLLRKFCWWGGCVRKIWWGIELGFGPAAGIPSTWLRTGLFFREKDPKPFPPMSATFNRADASPRRADQLAGLRQGPPVDLRVSPVGRPKVVNRRTILIFLYWPMSLFPSTRKIRMGSATTAGMTELGWMSDDYEGK